MPVLPIFLAAVFTALFAWAMGWMNWRSDRRPSEHRRAGAETAALIAAMSVAFAAVGGAKTNSPPDRLLRSLIQRALPATTLTAGYPYDRATWPFDAATSNAVSGRTATKVPPIPDDMADTGIAIYRVDDEEETPSPASNTVPVRTWLGIDADNRAVGATLPFVFPLGGTDHSCFGVFSNGRLALGHATRHRRTATGLPIAHDRGLNVFAPFWGEHLLRVDDGAYVGLTTNTDSFTVLWRNLSTPVSGSPSNSTVSATLLADGRMVWRYATVDTGVASNVTVGVQHGTNAWTLADAGTLLSRPLSMELVPVGGVEWALADDDGDSLSNYEEFMLGTNPNLADTDGDGPSDRWELEHGLPPDVPQLPDELADTDGDGIPDSWEARIGTNPLLADASSAPLHDTDHDGYLDVYETGYVHADPLDGSDPAEPDEASSYGRIDCEIDSSLPCWLVLSYDDDLEGTNDVRLAWVPGLSPTTVSLLVGASRPAKVYLEREETNGYWRASLDVYGSYLLTATKTSAIEPDTYGGAMALRGGGGTPVPYVPPGQNRGGENDVGYWSFTLPSQSISVCHSETRAEILLPSLAGYGGTVSWSIMTNGPSGTGNPIVFNPSELSPGYYDIVVGVATPGGSLSKTIALHVRTLSLTANRIVVDSMDTSTHYLPIDTPGTYIPDGEDFIIVSSPEGINSVEFVPADLKPGTTYTVDVWNGSCGYQTVTIANYTLISETEAEWPSDRARTDLGVGEVVNLSVLPAVEGVTWSCDNTKGITIGNGSSAVLNVRDVAGELVVSATTKDISLAKTFTVYQPGLCYNAIPYYPYEDVTLSDRAGGGCLVEVHYGPTNVCLDRVWFEECYAPATNVSGWYSLPENYADHDAQHGAYSPRRFETRNFFSDDISAPFKRGPWTSGSLQWQIPARWWIEPQPGCATNYHAFTDSPWTQSFSMSTNGTFSVRKFGVGVIRAVNQKSVLIYQSED